MSTSTPKDVSYVEQILMDGSPDNIADIELTAEEIDAIVAQYVEYPEGQIFTKEEEMDMSDSLISDDELEALDVLNLSIIEKPASFEEEIDLGESLEIAENLVVLNNSIEQLELPTDTSIVWPKDLSLTYMDEGYKKHFVPETEPFSQIIVSGNTIKDEVKKGLPKSGIDAQGDPKPNFLMVNIGFLLSTPNKHGEKFVSLPVRVPMENFFSVGNSWLPSEGKGSDQVKVGKWTWSKKVTTRLHTRHEAGKSHTPQKEHSLKKLQQSGPLPWLYSTSPTLSNGFHHSEQAAFEGLIRDEIIADLVERLHQTGVFENTTIPVVTLDMGSTRYMCTKCEIATQGMANPEYTFQQKLTAELQRYGYHYAPDKNAFVPRVVANRPEGRTAKMSPANHTATNEQCLLSPRPENLHNKTIYQMDVDTFGSPVQEESDLHRRTVFISSDVSGKGSYSEAYEKIVTREYAAMLVDGIGLRNQRIHQALTQAELGREKMTYGHYKNAVVVDSQEEEIAEKEHRIALEGFEQLAKIDRTPLEAMPKKSEILQLSQKLYRERENFERGVSRANTLDNKTPSHTKSTTSSSRVPVQKKNTLKALTQKLLSNTTNSHAGTTSAKSWRERTFLPDSSSRGKR